MNICEFFFNRSDGFLNQSYNVKQRLSYLSEIIDFVCVMEAAPEYFIGLINSLLDECDSGLEDYCTCQLMMSEIARMLGIKRNAKVVVIASENNWVTEVISGWSGTVAVMPCWAMNREHTDSYDYYIKCGEKGFPFLVDPDRLIDLYAICTYQFWANPSAYHIVQQYDKDIEKADTLITGMSYTRNAIRAEYYDNKIVSMANSSQDIYYDYMCFRNAISRNAKLRKLVVGLAPYSFRYDLSKTRFDYRLFFYHGIFEDCDAHNNLNLVNELKNYRGKVLLLNSIFGNEILDALYDKSSAYSSIECVEHRNAIFHPNDISDNEIKEMEKKYDKPYEETIVENKKLLKEYIDHACSLGIEVYVYIPPFSLWYKERWNHDYVKEFFDIISEISLSTKFELINMIDECLSDQYFGDYAHLNDLGAMYVAKKIRKIIS